MNGQGELPMNSKYYADQRGDILDGTTVDSDSRWEGPFGKPTWRMGRPLLLVEWLTDGVPNPLHHHGNWLRPERCTDTHRKATML
jgi:hypothetical protein